MLECRLPACYMLGGLEARTPTFNYRLIQTHKSAQNCKFFGKILSRFCICRAASIAALRAATKRVPNVEPQCLRLEPDKIRNLFFGFPVKNIIFAH